MSTEGNLRILAGKATQLLLVFALLLSSIWVVSARVHAGPLPGRSLRIGDTTAGATTDYTYTLSFYSNADVGSILFEYCTTPLPQLPCDTPSGLDASATALMQQSGETGFSIAEADTGRTILSRLPPQSPSSAQSQYTFNNIINPTGTPDSFFVRISTYQTTDATGPFTDFGAVANATTQGVGITTEVPPILKFCVGLTITADCTSADGNLVDLGTLSAERTASGSSQMVAATNAEFGLAIAAYGNTMTSGNYIIPALTVPTPSAAGNAQFGINLRNNSDPNIGHEPDGFGPAVPQGNYNIPDRYMFQSGDTVATSPAATDTRKFTVSYIVNIPPSQAPGVYTATMTYICTATF